MNLLLSAGEASGDLYGARLLKALQLRRPGLTAFWRGGARLAEAVLDTVVRSESLSVVGISEVVEKLPELRGALRALDQAALGRRPEAAVVIDFPDFHGFLTRRLKLFFLMIRRPPRSTLCPCTTLFRSRSRSPSASTPTIARSGSTTIACCRPCTKRWAP